VSPIPFPPIPVTATLDAVRERIAALAGATYIPPAPPDADCPPSADPGAYANALRWLPAEDAVLYALADAGGDLTAHKAVHAKES
jgi:hypothetical protein